MKNLLNKFETFFNVIKRLRNPGGCPWDIEQSPMTMRRPLLEETYEALDAIEENEKHKNLMQVREELGDVLLNVMMISYMYEQSGDFTLADVMDDVTKKLIRRHPHVFGETEGYEGPDSEAKVKTADSVLEQWEDIKQKVEHPDEESILDSIPKTFPPILRALKLSKKAAKTGFEWNNFDNLKAKIDEERNEFFEAVDSKDKARIEDELGDMFFIMVNAGRFLKSDPELALIHANKKFEARFRFVEKEMKKANLELKRENWEKMEEFWQKAKKELNN